MDNLFGILIIAIIGFLFWQQRRQTELAQYYIEQRCKNMEYTDVKLCSW